MATFPTAKPAPAPVRPTPSTSHARCCHSPGHGSPASQALPGLPASVHTGEGADASPRLKGKTHIPHMAPGPCRPRPAAIARPPPPSGLRNLLESNAVLRSQRQVRALSAVPSARPPGPFLPLPQLPLPLGRRGGCFLPSLQPGPPSGADCRALPRPRRLSLGCKAWLGQKTDAHHCV